MNEIKQLRIKINSLILKLNKEVKKNNILKSKVNELEKEIRQKNNLLISFNSNSFKFGLIKKIKSLERYIEATYKDGEDKE